MGDTHEEITENQTSSGVETGNQTSTTEAPVLDSDESKRSTDEPCVLDQSNKQNDSQVTVNVNEVTQSLNDEAHLQSERANKDAEGNTPNSVDSNTKSIEDIAEKLEASNTESHDDAALVQNDDESQNKIDMASDSATTDENHQKTSAENAENKNVASLKMLCQYGGDSSSDDEDDKDGDSATEKENNEKKPNIESDNVEAKQMLDSVMKSTDAYRLVTSDDSDEYTDESDDDGEDDEETLEFVKRCMGESKKEPTGVKNDLSFGDLPPIADLQITVPESECVEIGTVSGIVDTLVMVESVRNFAAVNIDTVLFLDKGHQALGHVFDVMGAVSSPIYCVRFNTTEDIFNKGIVVGMKVYVAPKTEYTQFIVLDNLMRERGCDASGEHDESDGCAEYSDDEEERQARQQQRHKKRANPANNDDTNNKNKTFVRSENIARHNTAQPQSNYNRQGQSNYRAQRDRRQGQQYPPQSMQQFNPNHSWHHALPPPFIQQRMGYNQYMGAPYGHPGAYQMPNHPNQFSMDPFPPLPPPNSRSPFGN